jgi:hypothetical protein
MRLQYLAAIRFSSPWSLSHRLHHSLFCLGIIEHFEDVNLECLFVLIHVAEHNCLGLVEVGIYLRLVSGSKSVELPATLTVSRDHCESPCEAILPAVLQESFESFHERIPFVAFRLLSKFLDE